MITVASFPHNWDSATIDPRLLESDYSWNTFDNPWPTNQSDTPVSNPEINPYLLPYGQDAFMSYLSPSSSSLESSFKMSDSFSADALYDSASYFPPLQNTLQGCLPGHQYSPSPESSNLTQVIAGSSQNPSFTNPISEIKFEDGNDAQFNWHNGLRQQANHYYSVDNLPGFEPILETPSAFNDSYIYPLSTSQHNHNPYPQLNEESALPIMSVKTELSLRNPDLQLSEESTAPSSSVKTELSPKVLPSSSPSPPLSPRSSKSEATPFQFITQEFLSDGKSRSVQQIDSDVGCGYRIELDARGKKYFQCKTCPNHGTYHKGDMTRHQQSVRHKAPSFKCSFCPKVFTRQDAVKRHMSLPNVHKRKPKRKVEVDDSDVQPKTRKRSKTS
ncbi:hypothetical protein CVT25_007000 [Psilocybe cyanescens]|uniref:C2H2-type domain-containing protein n=1 Tax=Psilocybe cyanescens TaxID=93625 RepID=A0A409WYC1_PSICY|nr:hypothetical protein CVT25_007000 [Psilocybe cyanescens]